MLRRCSIAFAFLVLTFAAPARSVAFEVSWWTIDGGGGRSSAGSLAVEGTIGQPIAQTSVSERFAIRGGFWGSSETVTAVDDPGVIPIPRAPRLDPPAPNPFNPRVSFRFALPEPRHTVLALYDAAGRRVRTLIADGYPAGSHEVIWDGTDDKGRNVASGVYFVQLRAGNFAAQHKVTLLE